MNIIKIAVMTIFCAGAFTSDLQAVLPPLYQTSKELSVVLQGDNLGKALPSGEPILEIRKNSQGYEITTLHYHVQANIIYKASDRPGPAQFEVEFEKADKINP